MLAEYSGEKLKTLRKRARLTQRQAAQLTGLSEAAFSYLEKGHRKPQSRTLDRMLFCYAQRIQQLKNLEKVFEETLNGGNLSTQTTQRNGSSGFHAPRPASAASPQR